MPRLYRCAAATAALLRVPALAVLLAALGVVASLVTTSPARADESVPFTDSAAKGHLGFCDAAGHQITSGSLTEVPFVLRAVSSEPTPAGYTVGAGAKATLFAFLPMQGVDPGDWTGQALTGAAFFSNPQHPMTEATVLDPTLQSFTRKVTVLWHNLIQLRMYIGAPGKPLYQSSYPTAVIEVTGSTWHVVRGGAVDCTSGRTKPVEELALPRSRFVSASASIAASRSADAASHSRAQTGPSGATGGASSGTRSGSPTPQAHSTSTLSPGALGTTAVDDASNAASTGGAAAQGQRAAAGKSDSSSGSSVPTVLLGGFAVIVLVGAVIWRVRSRRSSA